MLALVGGACRTQLLPPETTLRVPPELGAAWARTAILLALDPVTDPTTGFTTTSDLWGNRWSGQYAYTGGWYPESEGENVVYAAYRWKSHVLRVAIHYDNYAIQVKTIGSERLSLSETRIHKVAIPWLHQLDEQLQIALGRVAVQQR